jgi:integrase
VWQNVREDRWVLPEHKTAKSTGRPRVIFLNEAMRAMMERLKENGCTHVFLNTEGKPWTKSALQQQVWRIKTKLGLADDLCAYLCRHGFGTRAVLSRVDAPTVAELMGHNSLEMVSKVYVHLADQHQHLKAAVDKIMSSKPSQAAEGPTRKRAKPGPNAKKPGRKPKASSAPPTT